MTDVRSQEEQDAGPGATMSRTFWVMGVVVIGLLIAGYWIFIRDDFVPILTGMPPEEAAEVVKVLEAKKIPFRLSNEGTTILIKGSEADKARLELVGSELPIRGQVGFELFNQSDMGLTEFAQKINFQRALQGELARTILSLDGIRSVRVHLGLAERKIFRDEQSPPKASVTLILEPGAALTESRVSGIQRLVAGAVPDMNPDAVAVLDATGKIVSGAPSPGNASIGAGDAILENYRQRVISAIKTSQPWLRFAVNVSLRLRETAIDPATETGGGKPYSRTPRGDPDYVINVRITTPSQLDEQIRLELIRAIRSSAGVDGAQGDTLVFLVGEPIQIAETNPDPVPRTDRVVTKTPEIEPDRSSTVPGLPWLLAGGAAIVLISGLAVILMRRGGRVVPKDDRLQSFAEQLRQRIALSLEPRRG